ncbi:MAG: PIG-L family deacetylase [Candidatus Gracilibacteria bacterium]|nr:PIG-L family deacetylase [Candidatus Gracilibacteria bacterium]
MKKILPFNNINSVLVFAPHHDDESFGCGGTIKKLTEQGCTVDLAVVTEGRYGVHVANDQESIQIRERETGLAAQILGIRKVFFMKLISQGLEFNQENLIKFVQLLRGVYPDLIFLPHQKEMDRDHRISSELAREACWLSADGTFLKNIERVIKPIRMMSYEVWTPIERPFHSVVIDKQLSVKIKAMKAYKSQLENRNYIKMILGLNQYRARQQFMDGNYAESFSY